MSKDKNLKDLEKHKKKPYKFPMTIMDIMFFIVMCIYVSMDPIKNGINMSNIAAFLPTGIVLLLMIAKNLKENEIIQLESKVEDYETKIKKLESALEANIRKKVK